MATSKISLSVSAEELMWYVRRGVENRMTATTMMNYASSRSHSILTLQIEKSVR